MDPNPHLLSNDWNSVSIPSLTRTKIQDTLRLQTVCLTNCLNYASLGLPDSKSVCI